MRLSRSALALTVVAAIGVVAIVVALRSPYADTLRAVVFGSVAEPAAPPPRAPFGRAIQAGDLERPEILEASGLAPSRRRNDLLWINNDSGATARLFAVGTDGRDRGAVDVAGAAHVDWEDLDSFVLDGVPRLLIADVGDNTAKRSSVMLYVIEEPALTGDRFPDGETVQLAWTIELVYEDGPLDCEAVAVDVPGERILLVSKRTLPMRLYEVPLRPASGTGGAPAIARRVAEMPGVPLPTPADLEEDPKFGAARSQATAMDVTPDGRELLLLTYKNAYRFVRAEGETWAQVVSGVPEIVVLPRMAQTEAAAYSDDTRSMWVTTEQRPAPLYRLDRITPAPPGP